MSGELGALVRHLREAQGMSQRALARAAGVTPAYVSLIERGRRAPDRAVVEKLERALSASPADADALLHAAGYATASRSAPRPPDGATADVDRLLHESGLAPEQRAAVKSLMLIYVRGLIARAKDGRPLVSDLAAPWQIRVLEAVQEKMDEDSEHFREAYLHRVFDL